MKVEFKHADVYTFALSDKGVENNRRAIRSAHAISYISFRLCKSMHFKFLCVGEGLDTI